jgi:hypothetical protein
LKTGNSLGVSFIFLRLEVREVRPVFEAVGTSVVVDVEDVSRAAGVVVVRGVTGCSIRKSLYSSRSGGGRSVALGVREVI